MVSARAESGTAAVEAASNTLSRRRRFVVWALLVVASLLLLVSVLTTWVRRQMLDNQSWKHASTQVIQNSQVRTALSQYMVNQLYDQVNVEQALEQRLPGRTKQLAGPLSAALRQPATNTAEFILGRPRVQQLWINTTTLAHQKLVNVLENKTGHGISTGNGVVTLNLHSLIQELGTDLGLPAAALEKIPADAGVITVMRSDQLSAAQTGVRVIKVLSVWLLALVLGLYALAIYLARGARRSTLRNVGWAFVLVGLVILIVRRVVGNYVLDAIASPAYRGPVHQVWLIGTSILGGIGAAAILYGVIAIAGATLAGPSHAATAVRGRIAPVLVLRPGLAGVVVAVGFLLLVLWGPTHALRTWWGVLLLGGLLALGVVALRRQARAELAEREEAAAALHGWLPATKPASRPEPSRADELARLADLHHAGAISDDEYARAKELALL